MKLAKDDLVGAIRLRYDHYSAAAMFDLARERAGLADQPAYDAREVSALRAALRTVGDRLDKVEARIDVLLDGTTPDAEPAKLQKAEPAKLDHAKPAKLDQAEPANLAKPTTEAANPADVANAQPAKPEKPEPAKAEVASSAKPEPAKAESAKAEDAKPEPAKAEVAKPAPAASAAPAAFGAPAILETTIALTGVECGAGEQILMCGGFAALGDWDPARARAMSRDGDRWLATLERAPDAAIAFKFLRRTADGTVVWESGDNRELGATPRIDAVWR